MELGPSGYPFEKFIGEILKQQGYSVTVGVIVKGRCVYHEVDVIAEKDHHHFMIECKYHNQPGTVSNVKIPLYIQSRFKDIEQQWLQLPDHANKFHQGWVVTNTRFTDDAIQYGNCVGLHMMGWDYPRKHSLKAQIDMLELYPITCLSTLTKIEKQQLLDKNIVLCKEICDHEYHLSDIGIKPSRIPKILAEGHQLCLN
jgi:Holliday junction resolvase